MGVGLLTPKRMQQAGSFLPSHKGSPLRRRDKQHNRQMLMTLAGLRWLLPASPL